jgi:hypothetical protein
MKNKYIFFNIVSWFKDHRPEVLSENRLILAQKSYSEVIDDINKIEFQTAQILFLHEFLKLNYLKSGYNLIKDVFQENFPNEYDDFMKTPIFFEVNEEILGLCLFNKLFESYDQIFSEEKFYEKSFRDKISIIVKEVIS